MAGRVQSYWPLLWCTDQRLLSIPLPHNVMCFEVPSELMIPNPVTMKDFKPTSDNQNTIFGDMFCAFLELINRLTQMAVELPDLYANWGKVYVEIVPLEETPQQEEERKKIYKEEDLEDLPRVVRELILRWEPGRGVASIRFWVFITSPTACLGTILKQMFEDAQKRVKVVNNPYRARMPNSDKGDLCSLKVSGNINCDTMAVADLPDRYRWMARMISMNEWMVSVMHNSKSTMASTGGTNSAADIIKKTHPGHPINVFDPAKVWACVDRNVKVNPMYKTWTKYVTFQDLHGNQVNPPQDDNADMDAWFSGALEGNLGGRGDAMPNLGDRQNLSQIMNVGKMPFVFQFPDPRRVMGPLNPGVISPSVMPTRFFLGYQYGAGFLDFVSVCRRMKSARPVMYRRMTTAQLNDSAFRFIDQVDPDDLVPGLFDDDDGNAEEQGEGELIDPSSCAQEDVRETTSAWALLSRMMGVEAPLQLSQFANDTVYLIGTDGRKITQFHVDGTDELLGATDPITQLRMRSTEDMFRRREQVTKEVQERYNDLMDQLEDGVEIDGEDIDSAEELNARVNAQRRSNEDIMEECRTMFQKRMAEEQNANAVSFVSQYAALVREDTDCEGSDAIYIKRLSQMVGKIPAEKANFEIKYNDPDMSLVGHLIVTILAKLETVYLFGNTHRIGLYLWLARLSAARNSNDMHTNMLISGPKFTSKSFLIDWLAKICIQGLCMNPRDASAKAAFTDESQNGYIVTNHEANVSKFYEEKHNKKTTQADQDALSMLKESLAQSKVQYAQFVFNPNTGKRQWRLVTTYCNRVYVWVTNQVVNKIEEALLSRFHREHVTTIENPHRSNKTLENLNSTKGSEPRFIKETSKEFTEFSKDIQALYHTMERFIENGWLSKPTLEATEMCIKKTVKYLKERGHKVGDDRLKDRIREIAHILVVCTALVRYFYTPDGDGRRKKFEVCDLLRLDADLVDTEEIGWMAVTLHNSAFEDPHESDVKRAVALLFEKYQKMAEKRVDIFSFSSRDDQSGVPVTPIVPVSRRPLTREEITGVVPSRSQPVESLQYPDDRSTHSVSASAHMTTVTRLPRHPSNDASTTSNSMYNYFPEPEQAIISGLTAWEKGTLQNTKYDFNWACLPLGYSNLAREIQLVMEKDDANFPYKMTELRIREVLDVLKNTHLHLPQYIIPEDCGAADIILGRKQLIRMENADMQEARAKDSAFGAPIKFEYGKERVVIHYSFIESGRNCAEGSADKNRYKNQFLGAPEDMGPLHFAILESAHRFTKERKIVVCTENRLMPHIFHGLLLKKNMDQDPLQQENPFFSTEDMNAYADTSVGETALDFDSQKSFFNIDRTNFVLSGDEDVLSMQRRFATLHSTITEERIISALVHYNTDAERIKTWMRVLKRPARPYPMNMLSQYERVFVQKQNSRTVRMVHRMRKRKASQGKKELEYIEGIKGKLPPSMLKILAEKFGRNGNAVNVLRENEEDEESDTEEEDVDASRSRGFKRPRLIEDASNESSSTGSTIGSGSGSATVGRRAFAAIADEAGPSTSVFHVPSADEMDDSFFAQIPDLQSKTLPVPMEPQELISDDTMDVHDLAF